MLLILIKGLKMEALIISIIIYMVLVMISFTTYLIYSYLKREKPILKAIKINNSNVLSNSQRVAKLALSYKNGSISQAEFEVGKSQILG